MEELKFRVVYHLNQETPLIHFQHDQQGACLRASEVKPQLDRFLIGKLGGVESMKNDSALRIWFHSKENPSLNYKMRIRGLGKVVKSCESEAAIASGKKFGKTKSKDIKIKNPIAESYFGNMVSWDGALSDEYNIEMVKENYKETVYYKDGLELTILCFDKLLQETIFEHIASFFLLHNFGTRSNKGFGSYTVKSCQNKDMIYSSEELLKGKCPFPIYRLDNETRDNKTLLEQANIIYKLMKSGVNHNDDYFRAFIYQYMHKLDIGNEKAWLKRNDIAPVVGRNSNNHEHIKVVNPQNDKFVRAMLGVGDKVEYRNNGDTTKVSIKRTENGEEIKRFRCASPVVFKIFQGKLYILPFPVRSEILDKEFTFSSHRKGVIKTPDSFDMNDFIAQFAKYINADCDPDIYNTNNTNKKLSESSLGLVGALVEVSK